MQEGQNQTETWQQPHESSIATPSVPPQAAPAPPEHADTLEADDAAPMDEPLDVAGDDAAVLRWEGTEYLHQERSMLWFTIVGAITLLLVIVAIFVIKSITFAVLIPVMAIALFVYVRRPPMPVQYILSRKGLHIDDKLLTYDQFKSFGVLTHGGMHSVVLTPRKRFQIAQTVYFPDEVGEQLVDFLAARLPMKEVAPDAIDRLLSRIRL